MSLVSRAHKIDNEEAPQKNELISPMLTPALDTRKMATKQWLLSELVGMQKLYGTYEVNATTGQIWFFNDSPSAFKTFVGTTLDITKYFLMANWKFQFLIEWQSHHQQVGAAVLIQVPLSDGACQRYYRRAIAGINPSYFPHDFITYGHNGCLTVNTNFINNFTHVPLIDASVAIKASYATLPDFTIYYDETMEHFRLSSFSPLKIVTGGQSKLTVRVWQKLVSLDLEAYTGNY